MTHLFTLAARCALLAGVFGLAACGSPGPARIPVSGASGPNGGADTTVTFDSSGHGHFRG